MATQAAGQTTIAGTRFARLLRRGGSDGWNPDEVAAFLMARQATITRGLARSTPWAGIDDETLNSYYGAAAATIARIADSGERADWRSLKDLEKAQITAFRHEAFAHWKRANAESRRGDKSAVAFDAERHAPGEASLDKLFEQPDVVVVQRDLLADIRDERLRAFWSIVFRDQVTFKVAGDKLEMTKPEVMAATRSGRRIFAEHLDLRATGDLCRVRGLDITASRSGRGSAEQRERAAAHLEGCYACALVHEPRTSAFERGLLGLAPTGFVLRLLTRAGDAASVPVMRIAESGTVGRATAAGVAALAMAGAGVGVKSELEPTAPKAAPAKSQRPSPAPRPASAAVFRPVDPPVPPSSLVRGGPSDAAGSGSAGAPKPQRNAKRRSTSTPTNEFDVTASRSTAPSPAPSPSPPPEFDIERPGPAAATPPQAPSKPPTQADLEFSTP